MAANAAFLGAACSDLTHERRGDRVGCWFFDAGGMPATTAELLQHDRVLFLTEFFEKRD